MYESKDTVITKVSHLFVRRPRLSILLGLFLILAGYVTYSNLLKREGFPAVEVPVALVQTAYFVNDSVRVDQEITTPLEQVIGGIESVKVVRSTTLPNFSNIVIELNEGTEVKEAVNELRQAIGGGVELPSNSRLELQTFDAGAFDGEHDFIFSLAGNKTPRELEKLAEPVAEEISNLSFVERAEVIPLVTIETNPNTGEKFENQSSFSRVGFKRNDRFVFQSAIDIGVVKKESAGAIELSDQIRQRISELREEEKLTGLNVVYGGDVAISLRQQIDSLEESALLAIVIIIITLILFVNWRTSLVMAIFLPLTLGAVFISLYLIGYTLNVISLFALILVLGIFVDDGTIVVEAIDYYLSRGHKPLAAIRAAINDIGVADIAGTVTTMLVFVPMLFISGVLGKFIILIPVTVILAMGLSVIIALTIVPFLSSFMLQPKTFSVLGGLVSWLSRMLGKFTHSYLKRKTTIFLVLIFSGVLVLAGGFYANKLKFAIFSSPDDTDALMVSLSFAPGSTISQAETQARRVENIIAQNIGDAMISANYFSANERSALINILLTDPDSREITSKTMIEELNADFSDFKDLKAKATQISAGPPEEDFPFKMQIFSNDVAKLSLASLQVADFIQDQNFTDNQSVTEVKISELTNISKIDGRRYLEVSAKFANPAETGVLLELQEKIEDRFDETRLKSLGLDSEALGFNFGQESENLESFQSALVALGIAIVLIYLVLILQFDSFLQPLLVLLAIPFAIPGVFPGLYATDNALSFFSIIGIIALAGVVINNTILLMEYANHARQEDATYKEAIVKALMIRFRPIIATSVITIAALLPLGLSDPFWESLTFTIIFGLASSVILVLVTFPAYYVLVEAIRSKLHKIFSKFSIS